MRKMTILLTILKITGILLLSLLGFLLFLLAAALLLSVFKAKLTLLYQEEKFCFRFRYLFFSLGKKQARKNKPQTPKTDPEKKTNKPEKKEEEKEQNEPEEKSFFEKTVDGLTFFDYLAILKLIFRKAVSKIKIDEFFADVRIGGDAYDIAMEYGKINSALYPLLGLLYHTGVLKQAEINIVPDFLRQKTSYNARVSLSIRPVHLLVCAAAIVSYILRNRKKEQ